MARFANGDIDRRFAVGKMPSQTLSPGERANPGAKGGSEAAASADWPQAAGP